MTRLTDNSIRREPSPNVTVAISMAVYGMALCGGMLLIGLYHYRDQTFMGSVPSQPQCNPVYGRSVRAPRGKRRARSISLWFAGPQQGQTVCRDHESPGHRSGRRYR